MLIQLISIFGWGSDHSDRGAEIDRGPRPLTFCHCGWRWSVCLSVMKVVSRSRCTITKRTLTSLTHTDRRGTRRPTAYWTSSQPIACLLMTAMCLLTGKRSVYRSTAVVRTNLLCT